MKIDRVWAMPNRWPFTIKPIARLISRYHSENSFSLDPFAGMYSPAKIRNDLNPEAIAEYHLDALEFLMSLSAKNFDVVFFDPPYSYRQASEIYKKYGRAHLTNTVTNREYYSKILDMLGLLTRPEGIAISLGWNSTGLGKTRGFEKVEILLVNHGGGINDTIVTVERKIQEILE